MIIGIDPGITGAAAVLRSMDGRGRHGYISEAIHLPTLRDGPGKRRKVDAKRLLDWFQKVKAGADTCRVVIELVGPMPSDGKVGAFRFGMAVGTIHTVCRCLEIEPELVPPAVWKAYFQLDSDKEASRQMALKLYPAAKAFLSLKKDHNRAEAMLIARWAARPPIGRDW